MATRTAYLEWTPVPPIAITLPFELPLPDGFAPDDLGTWPLVERSLEYVDGKLLYMPPSGDEQEDTVADVATELGLWARTHREFLSATNEAGIVLGSNVRAADAALFRRDDTGPYTGGLRRVPPVLAVEVAGKDEALDRLLDKAREYLAHGVRIVWVLVPRSRRAVVVTSEGKAALGLGDRLPAHPSLSDLEPPVDDLFRQIGRAWHRSSDARHLLRRRRHAGRRWTSRSAGIFRGSRPSRYSNAQTDLSRVTPGAAAAGPEECAPDSVRRSAGSAGRDSSALPDEAERLS